MRLGIFPIINTKVKPAVEVVVLSGMLVTHLVVSLWLLSEKGLFIDDSMHIPAGYSYLLTHDYRLNQEHPPFIKLLSATGLWRVHPRFPFDSPGWQQAAVAGDPEDGMERIEEAFFDINADQFERISFWGRLPVIAVPLLLVLVVWWFGRQLFGPIAALMAGFLLMTEPNILGNSIVIQNDVAAALALLLFVVALRRYLTGTGRAAALMLGAALGFALIAKYSLLPLLPLSFLIVVVNGAVRVIRKHSSVISSAVSSCVVLVTAYFILLAAYAFHADKIDEDESSVIGSWFYLSGNVAELSQKFLTQLPPLLPKYFVYGINMVVEDSREGRPAFLLGQVSNKGWWYYFPVAFVLKTTIPFLISSVIGICWAIVHLVKEKRNDLLYLVLPPVLYLALCMTSHLNIGVRHILPIFPFFAIAGAGVLSSVIDSSFKQTRAIAVAGVVIVLFGAGIIALLTFPNYLTYFSPLAGGTSRGWKMLSDSNVETGQEVKTLAKYLKARGENRVAGVMIGGEFLRFYGVEAYDLPGWEDENDSDDQENAEGSNTSVRPRDADQSSNESKKSQIDDTEVPALENRLATDSGGLADAGPRYTAIGAWYMLEIGLSPQQKKVIDAYIDKTPEAMVGNSIFIFRRQ